MVLASETRADDQRIVGSADADGVSVAGLVVNGRDGPVLDPLSRQRSTVNVCLVASFLLLRGLLPLVHGMRNAGSGDWRALTMILRLSNGLLFAMPGEGVHTARL